MRCEDDRIVRELGDSNRVHKRSASGAAFSIVVVGEGAKPRGGEESVIAPGRRGHLPRLGGAGHLVAAQLQGRVPHEIRVTVLGHLQRGGSPSAFDRLLGTRFGVAAAHLCKEGRVGRMVRLSGTTIDSVPLAEAVGQPKLVTPENELVAAPRSLGIELGA